MKILEKETFMAKSSSHKKTQKTVERTVKKLGKGAVAAIVICLVVGLLIGALSCYFLVRNDEFTLVGEKTVHLEVGDTYGLDDFDDVKIVAFGKDVSKDVRIEILSIEGEVLMEIDSSVDDRGEGLVEIDTSLDSIYYIVYTVDNNKYKDFRLVREVIVGNGGFENE